MRGKNARAPVSPVLAFKIKEMKLKDAVRKIVISANLPVTPQEIRDEIKMKYPDLYGTPTHLRSVEKGHYKDIDHAILAQIYTLIRTSDLFFCDKTFKPMKISLVKDTNRSLQSPRREHISMRRTAYSSKGTNYDDKVKNLLINAEKYHQSYYKAETFRGPSLYFHHRALETRKAPASQSHLEYVYATLSSWGMHRMGRGGSKMQSFSTFQRSIEILIDKIVEAQKFNFHEMNDLKWALIKEIFQKINVMASGTSLVGNSKVMHHMLPNIIPPIDREYTLWFLRGKTTIKNDLEYEWQLMKGIISGFFIPVACDTEFQSKAEKWMAKKEEYPWDTSILKVVDNLVIGLKK